MFSARTIFKHYWTGARKHRWLAVVSFLAFGLAIGLSDILLPLLYRDIIDVVTSAPSPRLAAGEAFAVVWKIAGVIAVFNVLFRAADFAMIRFEARSMRDLSNYVFRKMELHSYAFFANQFVGSITAKARRFVNAFERILETIIFRFLFSLIRIVGVFAVLFFVEPVLGWIFLGWSAVYGVVITLRIAPQVRFDLDEAQADSRVTGRFADALTNILNIKMFAAEERESAYFGEATAEQERMRNRAWRYAMVSIGIQAALLGVLQVGAIYAAVRLWLDGAISAGTVVLVQSYILVLFGSLMSIGQQIIRFFQDLSGAQEMVDMLEEEHGVRDDPEAVPLAAPDGRVTFKNATFSYEEDEHRVLRTFSLDVAPGEKVGLVGPSGSGKSTITKLLLRFADLQGGFIEIDGQDVRKVPQRDLRSKIAYVPQDSMLFHRSLRENIAYGRPGAGAKEIEEAARRARIHEFIMGLPKRYDTYVGERGVKLSGGERQRVAIARAILKDAPILVLDEATSSLDTISERAVKEALGELMEGKTALVIAHRLSTVREMDRIVVLDEGQIIEEGSHEELLKKNGMYASLWAHQTGAA